MIDHIAIIGLGYIDLPVALVMAGQFPGAIGFDAAKPRAGSQKADRETGYFAQRYFLHQSPLELLKGATVRCIPGLSNITVSPIYRTR
jgi:hypothetical protein